MMISSLSVSIGVTRNVGNYESIRVDETVTAVVDPTNDPEGVRKALLDELEKKVNHDADIIAKRFIARRK